MEAPRISVIDVVSDISIVVIVFFWEVHHGESTSNSGDHFMIPPEISNPPGVVACDDDLVGPYGNRTPLGLGGEE